MTKVSIDAINRSINSIGESVTVQHYTGDQTYDNDQEPTRTSSDTITKAQITNPTKQDIEANLGKITVNDKKFMFQGDIDIDVGDNITVTAISADPFNVIQVDRHRVDGIDVKKIAFASKIK